MKNLKVLFVLLIIFSLIMCKAENKQPEDPLQEEALKLIPASIIDTLPVNPAMTFVQNMGIGINIGNTLDAIGTNDWHSGENGWGNPDITREFIQALKSYGYKSIRLPVTWAEYMGPAPDYNIGTCLFNCGKCPDRMDRVEEVVKWILNEDMYCIVNIHHDGGHSDKSWILDAEREPEKVAQQFAAVWKQIAQRFSGIAQDKLIFESMNEVGFDDLWNRRIGTGGRGEAYAVLNMLNQTFVDTVRGTAGNENRYLLIAGYWTNIEQSIDGLYKMPADTINNRLILSVHYYDPSIFCIAEETNNSWGFRNDWGKPADYAHLTSELNKLKTFYLNKGIPVIIGEYGVTLKNKIDEDRIKWMAAVTQHCLNYGICPILWDTGGEISRRAPYTMRHTLQRVWSILQSNPN
ncbi:MAG: cellulase family glycosylhydrolase [Treponema sp.]|nr:cellulase family glycosylhydrolase [Treponema sp.]